MLLGGHTLFIIFHIELFTNYAIKRWDILPPMYHYFGQIYHLTWTSSFLGTPAPSGDDVMCEQSQWPSSPERHTKLFLWLNLPLWVVIWFRDTPLVIKPRGNHIEPFFQEHFYWSLHFTINFSMQNSILEFQSVSIKNIRRPNLT